MAQFRKNLAVGVTVLVALILLGTMILLFGDAPVKLFQTSNIPVRFIADGAEGIGKGSPILYLGVNVGKVDHVERQADAPGVVIFAAVEEKPPLPANLIAAVKSTLIGGNSSLALELTGPKPQGTLARDATIPCKMGGTNLLPKEFSDLALKLQTMVDDWNQAKVINKVALTLDSVRKTVDGLDKIIGDEKTQGQIKETLANFKTVSENAKTITKNLEGFSDKLNKIATDVDKVTVDASATLRNSNAKIDELSRQINQRMEQAATGLDKLNSIATKIDKGDGTAGKIINDPRLYESLADTSAELNLTIKDLRRLVEQWEQEGVTLKLGGKK